MGNDYKNKMDNNVNLSLFYLYLKHNNTILMSNQFTILIPNVNC